jgi:gliding motility-associated-like protein/uncharacterized repeat protein (TIGR01451 family)
MLTLMKAHRLAMLMVILLFSLHSYAQTVAITYDNSAEITVCDTATFTVTLTNNLLDSAKMVLLDAVLPDGITYFENSVSNATESNISNLNNPVFAVENIGPGDAISVSFQALTDCELIAAIDGGELFNNSYNINWTGGSNNTTTIPYDIETALLQILSLTNEEFTGTKGDVFTRVITIQNTRLGALSKITFSDNRTSGSIHISTDLGMVTTDTPTSFQMMLTTADFMTIGDGDGLFELNEVILITETITITDCGFDENSVNSTLTISWGCNNEICQQQTNNALINLQPSLDNPNLVFTPLPSIPADFCGNEPSIQQIEISNNGLQPATDIAIFLGNQDATISGIDPTTVTIDSAGVLLNLDLTLTTPLAFENCGTVTNIFEGINFNILALAPGQSIIVSWEAYVCAVTCEDETPNFTYEFAYKKSCPEGDVVEGGGTSAGINNIVVQSLVTYQIGQTLMDNGVYPFTYNLVSPITQDSAGLLSVEYTLPCGLSWHPSNTLNSMALGGITPTDFEIVTDPNGGPSVITYTYPMPLGVLEVNTNFNVSFDCDLECIEVPECDTIFNTSCVNQCTGTGAPGNLQVFIETLVQLDTTNTDDCGIITCDDFELTYECPADSICNIPIVGYLDYLMDFNRVNFGEADNNDDRFADASGDLDFNQVRENRALAGDTLRTDLAGAVVIDVLEEDLRYGAITVQFEAHTADAGIEGFLALNQAFNRLLMTNENGFENLEASVRIVDASTGAVYNCTLGDPFVVDTIEVVVAAPNTRPEEILDVVLLNTYTYDISPLTLVGLGCNIPVDFTFNQGDSVIFQSKHKVIYNTIGTNNLPYVANLRTGTSVGFFNNPGELQDFPFVCNCQFLPWQLSGYRLFFSNGLVNIPPCSPSDEPGGIRFDLLLGAGNFFPFEFRNLAKILTWEYNVNPIATLLESELTFLQYQQGPTLVNFEPLNPTTSGNTTYNFDLLDYQMPLLDEGFTMRFRHLWELPCTQETALPLSIHAVIDIPEFLPEPEFPMDTIQTNLGTLNPIRPALFLIPANSTYTSFDNMAIWDFSLTNFPTAFTDPAPNVWFYPTSTNGTVTDFVLTNLTTGMEIPLMNELYQLGDFPINFSENYQLSSVNNSCGIETVTLTFGWNCDAYTNLNNTPCHMQTVEVFVTSPPGELEMDVVSPIGPFDLCEEIPYHTIEIFNAQLGAVYNVNLDAILPSGIILVPGSSELAYPTGTAFQSIADPNLNGGVYSWDISNLNNDIATGGLQGFQFTPNHSASIRFLVTTECGFVSSSFMEFTATATQNCDVPTNELTKASVPINIEGVIPPYESTISIMPEGPDQIECGEDFTFTVNMQADGLTLQNDSVFITLPANATYVTGSYVAGTNAVAGEPTVQIVNGLQTLKWAMIADLPPNTNISFTLAATGFGLDCDGDNILVHTLQTQSAVCITDGTLCSILVETGMADFTVITAFPILNLSNLNITGNGTTVDFDVDVNNSGTATNETITIDFYLDNDGNGQLSAGDTFVSSAMTNGTIGVGQTVNVGGTANFPADQICQILAVFDEDNNCACNSDIIGISGALENTLPTTFVCSGDEIQIGVNNLPGHIYSWNAGNNITCTDCAETTFSAVNTTNDVVIYSYVLTDESSAGCVVMNTVEVAVQPTPNVLTPDQAICEGDIIVLQTTPASSYTWTGTGITNPNAASQTVSPTETTTYTVEFTDAAGCTGGGSITITVVETETMIQVPLCDGDSTQINDMGTYFFGGEIVCRDTIINGCPSEYCWEFLAVDSPNFNTPDEICIEEGETAEITLAGNFSSYQWFPSNPDLISCDDCPDPTFTPQSAADSFYTLTVIDENGCEGKVTYFVNVLPQCSADLVAIPNAFTPNGDGINDVFGPVIDGNFQKIFDADDSGFSMRIYNRWGKKVFEAAGGNPTWDGTLENEAGGADVYIYIIEVNCGEERKMLTGDVALIR